MIAYIISYPYPYHIIQYIIYHVIYIRHHMIITSYHKSYHFMIYYIKAHKKKRQKATRSYNICTRRWPKQCCDHGSDWL